MATPNYYYTQILNVGTPNPFTIGAIKGIYPTSGDGVFGTAGIAWTVINLGTVSATAGNGVHLTAGGSLTNGQSGSPAGLISGSLNGVEIDGTTSGTVVNFATIGGGSGSGIYLQSGGTVVNSGTITTGSNTAGAVHLNGVGTVINSGLITGGSRGLLLTAGTVVNTGTITGGASGGVSLASGTNAGTLSNSGTITATGVGVSGGMAANSGVIVGATGILAGYVVSNGTTIGAPIVNTGTIIGTSGAALVFTATLAETIADYGTIGGSVAGTAVKFGAGADVLVLGTNAVVSGTLAGFTQLDTVDLAKTNATGAVFSGTTAGGTLSVMNGGTLVDTFLLAGQLSTTVFSLSPDDNGGTDIALTRPTGSVISNKYYLTSSVILSNPTTQNPLTVTSTGLVAVTGAYGIVGNAGTAGYAWRLTNLGTIASTGRDGVFLKAGGVVTNGESGSRVGLISGSYHGVLIYGTSGTVVNFATITGGGHGGVYLGTYGGIGFSGAVINSGVITAGLVASRATVVNSGTIAGGASGGVSLASGTNAGTLSNSGTITATGTGVLGGMVTNSGVIIGSVGVAAGNVDNGSGTQIGAPIVNTGTIIGTSGPAVAFTANLTETITNYGTIGGGTAGTAVKFGGGGDVLAIGPGAVVAGTLTKFTQLDTIDLTKTSATGATFSGSLAGGTLTVTNSGTIVDTLLFGPLVATAFTLSSDGGGGTDIRNKLPTGNVISYQYSVGVVLSNPLTQNSVTLTSSGVVSVASGDAVLGEAGYPWALSNLGTVIASSGYGVVLTAGGSVTNGQSGSGAGLISGIGGFTRFPYGYSSDAVVIESNSGTVVNFATIAGAGSGVILRGSAIGTVINFGVITSGGGGAGFRSGSGVSFGGGSFGMVINSGTISASGGDTGVSFDTGSGGTVNNSGVIAGGGLGLRAGSGTVINAGTITGGSGGAITFASGKNAGRLSNSGIILATGAGYGVSGGVVTNLASGRITGAMGVVAGYVISNGTTFGAPIVNYGTITGFNGAAVTFYKGNAAETITNFGTIRGTGIGTAVAFGGGADVLVLGTTSVLVGTLTGFTEFDAINLAGVRAEQAVFSGNTASGTLTVTNSGAIVDTFVLAGHFAATGFATSPDGNGGTDITIKQPGSIANGTYYQTVILSKATAQNPFTLTSSGLISVTSGDGILGTAGYAWTVTNLATVASSSGDGVRLTAGGSVTNGQSGSPAGLISGSLNGVEIDGSSGTVVNFATITGGGAGKGVLLGTGSSGTVINSGLIAGGLLGLGASGATVVNSGTITGGASGGVSLASGTNAGTLSNSGMISATGVGISGGMLTNSGWITGATGVVAGYVVSGGTTVGAPIVNTGTIIGTSGPAVAFSTTFTETIANYGAIGGSTAGTAVRFGTAADVLVIGSTAVVAGTLSGFTPLDTINLAHTTATNAPFSGNSAGGTLTVMNGGTTVATFVLAGQLASNVFFVSPDGNGGVDINNRKQIGNVIGGTYGYTVVLTGPNASTTVTSAGRITAPSGAGVVNAAGVVGTLTNMGQVAATGSGGQGVYLSQGGTVTNSGGTAGGYISGAGVGVLIGGTAGTVTNFGTVVGGTGVAAASGTYLTVTNSGTIASTAGTGGTAVSLAGGTSRLIVDPGAAFTGIVDGGGGASVLEIAALSGTAASRAGPSGAQGTVASVTLGSVVNFSAAQIDPSATLDNSGVISFDTLVNQGWINVLPGASLALGTVADAGSTGMIDLQQVGTIDFQGAVANQMVIFQPPGGTAAIDQTGTFGGILSGFTAAGDIVDLTTLAGGTLANGGAVNGSDQLVVSNATQSAVLQLDTSGDYTGIVWHTSADSGTGTDVAAACFCRGTLILTDRGEVAVEELKIGDKVTTRSGAARPVKWIGRRAYHPRFVAKNRKVHPIRIEAAALGEGVPARDLWVSPEHALYLDGVLVPARLLANGATIRQVAPLDRLEYFHLELDTHDLILAEGAPAETFVDCDNRSMFHNFRDFARRYPDARPTPWEFCAPRVEEGAAELRAIRALTLARAERLGRVTRDPDLHLVCDGTVLAPRLVGSHWACRAGTAGTAAGHGGARSPSIASLSAVAPSRVYYFAVPAGARSLSIASRSAVPAEAEASSADGRRLGVAVERVILRGAGSPIEIGHDSPALSDGFHEPEGSHRWSNGRGRIPATLLASVAPAGGDLFIDVHLAQTGLRYPLGTAAVSPDATRAPIRSSGRR